MVELNPPASEQRVDRAHASRVLSAGETEAVLSRNWWGVLATSAEGQPYAVPVAYGWTGTHLYIASLDGRKAGNLRANPRACLTVSNVVSGASWESVMLAGPVEWVRNPVHLVTAFSALARQCRRPYVPPSPERMLSARVFRIVPDELSGRARG